MRVVSDQVRSSRSEVFCKQGVFKTFVKFTGKHLCWNLFFNKVESWSPAIRQSLPLIQATILLFLISINP